jgi:NADPH:quinone reductase-like Zn-dependent oxidoreductase
VIGALILVSRFGGPRMTPMLTRPTKQDLTTLRGLLASGSMTPVVERTYPLHEVPKALEYLGEGHVRGKLIITLEGS